MGCASAPPSLPKPQAPSPTQVAAAESEADSHIPAITFRSQDGTTRTHFAIDEPAFAQIVLTRPLAEIREFDDDPDNPLLLVVTTSAPQATYGFGWSCTLRREPLRRSASLNFALALNPLAEAWLDPKGTDYVFDMRASGCAPLLSLYAVLAAPWVARDVEVRLEYQTRAHTVVLAKGHFTVADPLAHVELPKSRLAKAEAPILGWMKRRYPEQSYQPVRVIPLEPQWAFLFTDSCVPVHGVYPPKCGQSHGLIDAFVVFQRDNGTCVARLFELRGVGYGDYANDDGFSRVPERDREIDCKSAVP
jgi:hypothetical protein